MDHTSHIVNHLFYYSRIRSHWQLLIDGSLHWVSKRDLLGQNCIYASIVGDYKFSLHTTWSAEGGHWHLKDMPTRDGICLSLFQHIIYHPCLNYWSWSRHFFYAESECLIGSELEVYIILLELINKHATKLLSHLVTSRDSPIVAEHYTGRTVKTEVKLYSSILTSLVCHHEVELLVLRLHLGQVQSIPFLTSLYIYATPFEVICLLTSQVHDVTCLILLSRKHDVLCRCKLEMQVANIHLQELLHVLAPKLIVLGCNSIFCSHCGILSVVKSCEGYRYSCGTIHTHLRRHIRKVC